MKEKLALTFLGFVLTSVMITTVGYALNIESAIAVWLFDEGRGETARDLSGNGHKATLQDGTQWDDGKFGSGLSFDGQNDYVSIGESRIGIWVPEILRLCFGSSTLAAKDRTHNQRERLLGGYHVSLPRNKKHRHLGEFHR